MHVIPVRTEHPAEVEPEDLFELMSEAEQDLADRVEVLYRQSLPSTYLGAGGAIVLVAMVSTRTPESHLWYWLIGMASMLMIRIADIISYRQAKAVDRTVPRMWLIRFSVGMALTALAWNLFVWLFFPALDMFSRSAVAIVLAMLAGSSVNALAPVRGLAIGYTCGMLVPPSLTLLFSGDPTSLVFGAVGLAVSAMLAMLINSAHRDIGHSLQLARQNRELERKAEQRQLETLSLNAELTLARSHLMDANAGLEEKVAERTAELEREMAERLNYQRELERLANEDALTGLYNRHCFAAKVKQAIDAHSRDGRIFAIYFVDLDRFKEINDGLGHPAGDLVLRTTADRIRASCGERVACARWGGDEFVLLQTEVSAPAEVQLFGELLLKRIAEPIDAFRATVTIGASIGISMYPEHGASAPELVEHADIAVYKAKRLGRACVCVYRPEWGVEARRRLDLVQALRRAIENDALTLNFQPVVAVPERRLCGLEALTRWNDPEHGFVSPGVFIPIAEESGLMPELGSWVLRKACAAGQQLFPGDDGPTIAINTSVAQLMKEDFVDEVRGILARTGLSPRRLELEMTESLFAENIDHVKRILQELRAMGIRISIDDFGTGYSSLSYLRSLPLDTLKIDRSFVVDLNHGGDAIFSTFIHLAESLGLEVIVEGVETEFELDRVINLGGRQVQGYYFAKPMPISDIPNWRLPPRPQPSLVAAAG